MEDLHMRTNLLINASVENSRDLMRIKEALDCAGKLRGFARDFTGRKFDVANHPIEGTFTLLVFCGYPAHFSIKVLPVISPILSFIFLTVLGCTRNLHFPLFR